MSEQLRTAAQQALEFIKATNASSSFRLVPESNLNKTVKALRAALEQPEPGWRLSCGCPSHHGGIPAEWPATTREGDPATAYGVVCEKHWHEYEARCPNCASLQEQNTELDKKLAELSERHLTDEVIADLWHQNGGFHHHFARAVERWLKGKNHA